MGTVAGMHRLGETIEVMLEGRDLTKKWLGEQLGVDETTAARRIRSTRLTVQDVLNIERALEMPQGYLFRLSGIVADDPMTADYAITADTRLPLRERHALATVVRAFLTAFDVDPAQPIRTLNDEVDSEVDHDNAVSLMERAEEVGKRSEPQKRAARRGKKRSG